MDRETYEKILDELAELHGTDREILDFVLQAVGIDIPEKTRMPVINSYPWKLSYEGDNQVIKSNVNLWLASSCLSRNSTSDLDKHATDRANMMLMTAAPELLDAMITFFETYTYAGEFPQAKRAMLDAMEKAGVNVSDWR